MSTDLQQNSRKRVNPRPARGTSVVAPSVPAPARLNRRVVLYSTVTFLSAFLLFQVQFLIAKYMLPWFGGTPAVWLTSLFFFQTVLLAGYGYSHLSGRLAAEVRFRLHTALLLVSVAVLALAAFRWPTPITRSAPLLVANAPVAGVLGTLFLCVGLPFWLLSSTSPLLQDWYAQSGAAPFRLYAVSNLGSLIGLISYPFLVEPLFPLRRQAWWWCAGYVLFVAGSIVCGFTTRAATPAAVDDKPQKAISQTRRGIVFLWITLPAVSSALLLGTTNYLTQDIASVPLFWVMPLAVYLASFVVSFAFDSGIPRWLLWPPFAIFLSLACDALLRSGFIAVRREIWIYGLTLLFGCLICHSELARVKPEARRLTTFYLCLAAGSALGSALVAVVAPHVFRSTWEFQIALAAAALLGIIAMLRDVSSWMRRAASWQVALAAAIVGIAPMLAILTPLRRSAQWLWQGLWALGVMLILAAALAYWCPPISATRRRNAAIGSLLLPCAALAVVLGVRSDPGIILTRQRNFYGVIRVVDDAAGDPALHSHKLYDGRILHGLQMQNPEFRSRATSYYNNESGMGLALRFHPRRWNPDRSQTNLRFALVGMGAGTGLIYALPGDYVRIYELNPAVVALSRGPNPYFTYLRDCRGATDVIIGDGRIALQNEAERGELQNFDVIVLDAFSGDAIPTHLLTREAMQLYLRHLRDANGIIAIHITNKVIDLAPVLARLAQELNLEGVHVMADAQGEYILKSEWVLLSPGTSPLRTPPLNHVRLEDLGPAGPLWTDDFSNLFAVFR